MKLDILAIGAHPDDVELSCAGTIVKHKKAGKKIGICDITRGELSTRGNLSTREKETDIASKIMGISVRVNLNLPDGFFKNDQESQLQLVKIIRKYRPEIVLAPALYDRHPDHGRAAKLCNTACFLSGLSKVQTSIQNVEQEPWRPRILLHYIQDYNMPASILVDISKEFETKMDAIKAYSSQFYSENSNETQTPISTKEFLEYIEGRSKFWARCIGVEYAEAFVVKRPIGIKYLDELL
jgi:bacillithiol biosynthesis deacetylase BshB1